MTVHQILMPQKIIYGNGSLEMLGSTVAHLGKHVLLISDPIMEKSGLVTKCTRLLENSSLTHVSYTAIASEPTDVYVKEALQLCRDEQCDLIVAIGGGSCIDTAKAVGILATNVGHMSDYAYGKQPFVNPSIPLIAVPTTAGSGSEVSKVTVITDTTSHIKMMFSDPVLMPSVALVDPLLTLTCPPHVTAATGVDALCHAIESFLSAKAQPITDLYALQAISLISKNLRDAYSDGQNLEAREQVAMGSMLAGMAFSNSSVTLVHGMSRPIGALFHVPHGISNAMLLPVVLEFIKDSCKEKMITIGRLLDAENQSSDDTVSWVRQICRDLHIGNLKQWGIDSNELNMNVGKMATDALNSGSPANSPRVPRHEEIIALYLKAYDYVC